MFPTESSRFGSSEPSSILIVEDHPLVCEGLTLLINREPDLRVTACVQTISDAKAAMRAECPALLLLDLRLNEGGDTIEFIKAVRASYPRVRILVLSQLDEMIYAERCIRAGADGYLTKLEACAEVLTAIRAVLNGESYVSRKVALLVFHQRMSGETPKRSGVDSLTDRQLHVFQLLGAGLSTRQIAERMKLSIKTVETHREHIKHKLALSDAVELVKHAKASFQGTSPSGL
jgi:DNA-binding NarL/FixJ family response regulator